MSDPNNLDEISSVLFMAREALVYKVPPRTTNEGYRASTWNDQGFLWKGRVRVLEIGERCEIRLEDANTGELFALTKYTPTNNAVEPVLDSSRYFVLRVEGEGGRKAYIGMGFEERGDAFDFNVALQTISKRTSTPSQPVASEPAKDYSLKDGQTFSIKIPGRERRRPADASGGAGAGIGMQSGGGVPLLAPPPPSSRKR
ncbi:hypothetical protein NCC49_003763 [Naganishia albida]|nr:hypothetical protein NCC49_003763 [Naganishia albida]